MSAVVLLSGGQDSTTVLFLALERHDRNVVALTIDYGQRHAIEIEAARKVASMAGVAHEVVQVPAILRGTSPLVDRSREVAQYAGVDALPGGIEATFVPARNMLFLAIAANRAMVQGADSVVIGVSQEDFGGYPDCRGEFVRSAEVTLSLALGRCLVIESPLISRTKRETVKLAVGLPGAMDALAWTHTCYRGDYPPCGSCHACLLRKKGFDAAGIEDPLIVRARRERP